MNKICIDELKYLEKDISNKKGKNHNRIYRLNDNKYLKVFAYPTIKICDKIIDNGDYNIERKILCADQVHNDNIVKPTCAVYADKNLTKFKGYIMDYIAGVLYLPETIAYKEEYKYDLNRYANIYLKLEDAVKRANEEGVILPDLLTIGNIIMTSSDGDIKFIDYDGMQVGNHASSNLPVLYYKRYDHIFPKYKNHGLYNINIDKYSLMLLYIINTFDIDADKADDLLDKTGKGLMDYLGMDDDTLRNAIGSYFNLDKDNDYLGNIVNHIALNYDLLPNKKSEKKLVKKR